MHGFVLSPAALLQVSMCVSIGIAAHGLSGTICLYMHLVDLPTVRIVIVEGERNTLTSALV